jgi:hypothetical protein
MLTYFRTTLILEHEKHSPGTQYIQCNRHHMGRVSPLLTHEHIENIAYLFTHPTPHICEDIKHRTLCCLQHNYVCIIDTVGMCLT